MALALQIANVCWCRFYLWLCIMGPTEGEIHAGPKSNFPSAICDNTGETWVRELVLQPPVLELTVPRHVQQPPSRSELFSQIVLDFTSSECSCSSFLLLNSNMLPLCPSGSSEFDQVHENGQINILMSTIYIKSTARFIRLHWSHLLAHLSLPVDHELTGGLGSPMPAVVTC